jgi:NodT family efflux transporter outer membrane factor (OMF) lipoprotein
MLNTPPHRVPGKLSVPCRHAARALCTICCFGLSACVAVGPDFRPPPVQLQDRWTDSREGGARMAPAASDRPAPDFWAGFNDPVLTQLLEQAMRNNRSLQSTAQKVAQAALQLGITQAGRFPSVQYASQISYTRPDLASSLRGVNEGSSTRQLLGQLSWETDFWGSQRRAEEEGRALLDGAQAALAAARVSLQASVASAYYNVRVLERRIAVARQNLEQQEANLRIAETRFRLGGNSELDYRQAQTQAEQTRSQLPVLQGALAQYRHALSVLLGETPDFFERRHAADGDLPAAPAALAVGAPRDLLRRRPDIRQAEMAAAAQSARIGQATAALYPSLSLSGAFGLSSTAGKTPLFSWDSRAVSASGGLHLPLFDRERLHRLVRVQDSVFLQAIQAYQDAVLKAQQEVEDALAAIASSNDQIAHLRQADAASARSAALAAARYRAGQTDYTTVSSAEQARLQVSDALAQAQGTLLQASIGAFRAVGGGWDGNLESTRENAP